MTFSLMYMFGLLELLTSTKSGKVLLSGLAEEEDLVFPVPQIKDQHVVQMLNQVSDKAAETILLKSVSSEIHRKASNSTLCQSLTEQKDDKMSVEFTRKPNLPPTTGRGQKLEMVTYPKRRLWEGEIKYWRWKLGALLMRMKTSAMKNIEESSRHVDSSGRKDHLGSRVRSKRAAKRKRRKKSKHKKINPRKLNFDETEKDGDYFSQDLLKSYLDDGYKVRVYSSDSYDVIFRKGKRNKQKMMRKKSRLLQNQELLDTFDNNYQRRRHRRHLSQDQRIKISPASRQVIIVKRRDSVTPNCGSNPCKNGATCLVPDDSEQVVCKCLLGFAGDHCETPLRECLSLPCQNGATCIDHSDSFECFCQPGYFGTFCENDVNDCASVPCLNGGRCHDLVNGYRCSCGQKFEGKNCENRRMSKWFQICESNVCLNGGVCVMRNGDVQCICAKSFTGNRCEISLSLAVKNSAVTSLCAQMPCLNDGVCKEVDLTRFVCKCPALFKGETCAIRMRPCASHPCPANEVCAEDESSFTSSYECKPGRLTPESGYSGGNNVTVSYETVNNYNVMRVVGIIVASLLLLSAIFYIFCLFIYYNPYDESSRTEEKFIYQSTHDYKKLSTVPTNPSSDREPRMSDDDDDNNNNISTHHQVRNLNNNSWNS